MKKLLLIALASSFGLSLVAQKNLPNIPDQLAKKSTIAKQITVNDGQVIVSDQTLPLKAAMLAIANT